MLRKCAGNFDVRYGQPNHPQGLAIFINVVKKWCEPNFAYPTEAPAKSIQ